MIRIITDDAACPEGAEKPLQDGEGSSLVLSKEILKCASAVPTPGQIPLFSQEHTRHLQQSLYFFFFLQNISEI